jgi:hypothetical protein
MRISQGRVVLFAPLFSIQRIGVLNLPNTVEERYPLDEAARWAISTIESGHWMLTLV